MKSTYVCFREPGKVELCEERIGPPHADEILCQSLKSLVSTGTETYCLRGVFDPGTNWADWVRYPFRPGYSTAARVIGVGRDVTDVREGDRVFLWTPHQQYFTARPGEAYLVPDDLTDEEATWGCLACTTQLAVRRAELQLGETVGIVGLGLLGQLLTQYVLINGARRVFAIDTVQGRLDMAKAHGATHLLCTDATAARAQIGKMTEGRMLDAVWDATGHPAALSQCVQLLHQLGRVVLVGDTPTPMQQPVGPGVVSNTITILGVHAFASAPTYSEWTPWTRRHITELFFDYLRQGRMRVSDLVTHRYSPVDAPQAYARLLSDRAACIGVIFDWGLL